jgi:hypothetical protein
MGPRREFKEKFLKRRGKTQGCASKGSSAHDGENWGKVAVDEGSTTEGTTLRQSAGIGKGARDRRSVRARRERNAAGARQARGTRTRRRQASRSSGMRIWERRRERGDETRTHGSHGVKSRFVGVGRSRSARERRTAGAARVVQRRDQTEKWARDCLPFGEGARCYLYVESEFKGTS